MDQQLHSERRDAFDRRFVLARGLFGIMTESRTVRVDGTDLAPVCTFGIGGLETRRPARPRCRHCTAEIDIYSYERIPTLYPNSLHRLGMAYKRDVAADEHGKELRIEMKGRGDTAGASVRSV